MDVNLDAMLWYWRKEGKDTKENKDLRTPSQVVEEAVAYFENKYKKLAGAVVVWAGEQLFTATPGDQIGTPVYASTVVMPGYLMVCANVEACPIMRKAVLVP